MLERFIWGVAGGHEKTRKKKGEGGGMVMEIRREMMEKSSEIMVKKESIMMGYVEQGREKWRIVGNLYERGY